MVMVVAMLMTRSVPKSQVASQSRAKSPAPLLLPCCHAPAALPPAASTLLALMLPPAALILVVVRRHMQGLLLHPYKYNYMLFFMYENML